jgi:hypothetical protein
MSRPVSARIPTENLYVPCYLTASGASDGRVPNVVS